MPAIHPFAYERQVYCATIISVSLCNGNIVTFKLTKCCYIRYEPNNIKNEKYLITGQSHTHNICEHNIYSDVKQIMQKQHEILRLIYFMEAKYIIA